MKTIIQFFAQVDTMRWLAAPCALVMMAGVSSASIDLYRVHVVEMRGEWTDEAAQVVWVTDVETGSAGFRVERLDADGAVALHEGWLQADLFTGMGQTYRVMDPTRSLGSSARYRVEELRTTGEIRDLGEWDVVFEVPAPVRTMAFMPMEDPIEVLSGPSIGPALKVPVVKHDFYAVSLTDIANGLGLSVSQVAQMAADEALRVHWDDQSVAYLYEPALEQIVFYGWPITNRYTRTNYFWIEPGPGLHVQRVAPEPVPVSSDLTHMAEVYFKQNGFLSMDRFQALPDDFYFWTTFNTGNPSIYQRILPLSLEGYAGGDAALRVNLHGWNIGWVEPNHIVQFDFNGISISGQWSFTGLNSYTAHVNVASGLISSANNSLTIRGAQWNSLFVLHHIWAEYSRYYEPASGLLLAPDGGHPRLTADRFGNAMVFDVTNPFQPVWIADETGSIAADTSWPVGADSLWAMRERSQVQVAQPIPAGLGGWMRASTNSVDYLVIAPRAFEAPAQAMADYRASLGLRTAVALFEDICDEFAGGLTTPDAIRDMLVYAHTHWQTGPRMVLLGGWGHFDYLNVSTAASNWLPPLMGTDGSTLRAADAGFADLNGDGIPDLALGRLPVQNAAQFYAYIDKLETYEMSGPQVAYDESFLLSGRSDMAGDFLATNTDLSEVITNRYEAVFAAQDLEDSWTVNTRTKDALANSSGILHYSGHGSITEIARPQGEVPALSVADVNAMPAHDPIPLFISLTCYMGRFDHHLPSQRCLAEALVLKPNGGALAVYSPSGVSFNYFASQYAAKFYELHAVGGADTLGTTLKRTRQYVLENVPGSATPIRTYNLLGDPALRLRGGEGGISSPTAETFAEWRWERFSTADLADPTVSGAQVPSDIPGANNLQRYAFGDNPAVQVVEAPQQAALAVEWEQRTVTEDLAVEVWMTTDLMTPWTLANPSWKAPQWVDDQAGVTRYRLSMPEEEWPTDEKNVYIKLRAIID